MAAPPARRCAPGAAARRVDLAGCSARAEMRRSLRTRAPPSSWLLRPRGDAPCSCRRARRWSTAAPPARRCAVIVLAASASARGCSARAEMRRRPAGSAAPLRGLLRPRGDAPLTSLSIPRPPPAAPPARRCARGRPNDPLIETGCSARAEMRPKRRRISPSPSRLLRPRGDAPIAELAEEAAAEAAPPARRCAAACRRAAGRQDGCSARAEMRPSGRRARRSTSWLLRPRGDAPFIEALRKRFALAAPPARRCARAVRAAYAPADGCSARAEMRPHPIHRPQGTSRLLRPRGDAPASAPVTARLTSAAPPARRCARSAVVRHADVEGCSARAEMRRTPRRRCGDSSGLLRPRGDAPAGGTARATPSTAAPPARRCAEVIDLLDPRNDGCSARAEMRLNTPRPRVQKKRLLRPRAGHARRCALSRARARARRAGCSARAEMRPDRCSPARSTCRLLRPRGDAPQIPGHLWSPDPAAPPARRCARGVSGGHRGGAGCSARAEMRPGAAVGASITWRLLRPRGDAPHDGLTSTDVTVAAPPARRCA